MYYIVCGAEAVGNMFGYFGHLVPEGKCVLAQTGEYTNGGHGPIARSPMFSSPEEAREYALTHGYAVRENRYY